MALFSGPLVISGGHGLLGSHVTQELITHGTPEDLVHVIVTKRLHSIPPGVHQHVYQLGCWSQVEKGLPTSPEVVMHLAQARSFREFPDSALGVFDSNLTLHSHLLDYAYSTGARLYLYASSGGVYQSGASALSENSNIRPPEDMGYYLSTKLAGEMLTRSYAGILNVVILRIFFMYGPKQHRAMLLPRLYDQIARHEPIPLAGDEGIRINPVHVREVAAAANALAAADVSATINIAGPQIWSVREISEMIGQHLNISPRFSFSRDEAIDLVGETQLLETLGLSPSMSLPRHLSDLEPSVVQS